MAGKVKVGVIGSRFEADIHAASFQILVDEAEVVAVASPTPGNARRWRTVRHSSRFHDYREMLRPSPISRWSRSPRPTAPREMTSDAAGAGKHVVCEKPLCLTLEEADPMIETCRGGRPAHVRRGAALHPKYVKAK